MAFPDDLLIAVASALGSSTEIAGYVLGSILLVTIVIPFMLFKQDWKVITLFAVLGAALATAFVWYPPWIVVLLVIVLAAMIVYGD